MNKNLEARIVRLEKLLRCESLISDARFLKKTIINQIGRDKAKFLDVTTRENSTIIDYYDEDGELVSHYKVTKTPDGYILEDMHKLHRGFKPVISDNLFEVSLEVADNILSDFY